MEYEKLKGGFLWPCFAGLPDFSEVYGFIGSVFDPEIDGHVQKLKEMDPINFETVSWMKLIFSFNNLNCQQIAKIISL